MNSETEHDKQERRGWNLPSMALYLTAGLFLLNGVVEVMDGEVVKGLYNGLTAAVLGLAGQSVRPQVEAVKRK